MKSPRPLTLAAILFPVLFVLGASLLFLSCSHGSGLINGVDWKSLNLSGLPGTAEYPDAEALVLLDEGTMETIGSGEVRMSVFERHRVVKVLTAAGQHFANVVIPYGTGTELENIQARTISPDGTVTPVTEADIFDVSLYPNFVFFSDQRARLFTLPAVEKGSMLEYQYRLRMSGHTLWHSWSFQDRVPTLRSRFTLISPSEYPINARLYNISIEAHGSKMPAGFKQTTIWEARDVPPLLGEFGMPADREAEARLAIAPIGFRSWNDVAKWYSDLVEPRAGAGPRIKALVSRITTGAMDDSTKLRRIYEWVQQQVRYMAVEIGIGGYQPHPAEDVCSKLYGDCKDMTTLLCSMAQVAGIDVRQVLVSTWQNGRPDTSLPSPLQFNHAIAYAPSVRGGVWMDATEKWCRFGELPWFDQGLPVLLVEQSNTGRIITTPRTAAADNHSIDTWDVQLDSTGAAFIRGETRFAGMPAIEERNEVSDLNSKDRRRWLEGYLARRCPGAMLDSLQLEGLRPDGDDLRVGYLFHTSMFAVRRGSGLIVHPGWISSSGLSEYFRSSSRVHPVRFRFGTRTELLLRVHLPDGWSSFAPEVDDSVRSAFGEAYWNCKAQGGELTWRSGRTFMGDEVAPAQYARFQKFLDAMELRDMREIEVEKTRRRDEEVKRDDIRKDEHRDTENAEGHREKPENVHGKNKIKSQTVFPFQVDPSVFFPFPSVRSFSVHLRSSVPLSAGRQVCVHLSPLSLNPLVSPSWANGFCEQKGCLAPANLVH